jgi:puromycin-sensitive aminopeptidase
MMLFLLAGPQANVQQSQAAVAAAAQPGMRLPPNVVPVSYDIRIAPNLEDASFSGDESIQIQISGDGANSIWLHSKDLTIDSANLIVDKVKLPLKVEMSPETAMAQLVPTTPSHHLNNGVYEIGLHFSGQLNDKLVGFYKSTFKDAAGQEHTLAVTQMEPADARRMFPSFDEPQFKATFKLTVQTRTGLNAVSNAPLERRVDNPDGTTVFHFAATPRMSSYLVALVVGELEASDPVSVDGVPIRVWSVAGKRHLANFSRDEAAKILPVLTSYFGIAYPWKKLDLIAIPDFEAGAMENPGAITFRETLLLIDPATASARARHGASSVIAHEMAHLWFGDLVTMKWWDDLWLNEAFATWMATKAVDKVHPDWDFWKEYSDDRSGSMETDSLKSSRAIHSDVVDPDKAHEMFDVITYSKGASILRMLERYVSEKTFQQGVHDYLTKHSFANATTEDLWDAIGTASGAPVRQIMQNWVHKPGYPLLTLALENGNYSVNQHRFLEIGSEPGEPTVWQVPIGLRSLSSPPAERGQTPPQDKQLLTTREGTLTLTSKAPAPYIANAGGVGYYRVKYPDAVFKQLTDHAEKQLDASERLTLVDDTWALVQSTSLDIERSLDLMAALRRDKDELVQMQVIDQLEYLDRFVQPGERSSFERFVHEQLAPLYERLGWQAKAGDSDQIRTLRGQMLTTLGTIGQDKDVIATARKYYEDLVKAKPGTNAGIDSDLMSPITSIVAYNGGEKEFEFFKSRYQNARTPEEEHRNLMALALFRTPELVGKVLDMSINGSVRSQDAPGLLSHIVSRRDTNERGWDFVETNWTRINAFYPEEMVPRVVSSASRFHSEPLLTRARAFLSTHKIKYGESTVARTLERMEINSRFRERNAAALNASLRQRAGI